MIQKTPGLYEKKTGVLGRAKGISRRWKGTFLKHPYVHYWRIGTVGRTNTKKKKEKLKKKFAKGERRS